MKVPSNFSASATKKVNPLEAAIAGNFTQNQQPSQNASQPSQPAKSQILNEMPLSEVSDPKTPARREVKEKFLVSMSKGERSIFKSFCALKGVSMNHFVMCAMDYFKEDLENGKVSISSHSYKRKEV